MAGFRKAKAEQAALKIGIYGPPGSGKTLTSLLIAEGLAKLEGKRVAYIDTERGTDFYCQAIKSRTIHPEAFDFDAEYTRSLTTVVNLIKGISEKEHCVVVIDSITHLWDAAIAAYSGRQTSIGSIPMHAWGKIKKPYKELMTLLLSSRLHVIICGRQGTEYATDDETEELKAVGLKMKAEGETAYEPHILLRMEAIKPKKTNEMASIVAYAEKDRTGVLSGRSFVNPTFDSLCANLIPLLGGVQGKIASAEETSIQDAEALEVEELERSRKSADLLREWSARIDLCKTKEELKAIGKGITPALKSNMTPVDIAALREKYLGRETSISMEPESQNKEEKQDV